MFFVMSSYHANSSTTNLFVHKSTAILHWLIFAFCIHKYRSKIQGVVFGGGRSGEKKRWKRKNRNRIKGVRGWGVGVEKGGESGNWSCLNKIDSIILRLQWKCSKSCDYKKTLQILHILMYIRKREELRFFCIFAFMLKWTLCKKKKMCSLIFFI